MSNQQTATGQEQTVLNAGKGEIVSIPKTIQKAEGVYKLLDGDQSFKSFALAQMIGASQQNAIRLKKKFAIQQPDLTTFIGKDTKEMVVSPSRKKFIFIKDDSTIETLNFATPRAKKIISFVMVILPDGFKTFKDSPEYHALAAMNLTGYLTAKAKVSDMKTRDTLILSALNMHDIWVIKDGKVFGQLYNFSQEELDVHVMEWVTEDGKKKYVRRSDVTFAIAKDVSLKRIGSIHSLYQKQSGSLAYYRMAMALKKKFEKVLVAMKYSNGAIVQEVFEEIKALVLDEVCVFDASNKYTLPFGDVNESVYGAVFSECKVIHSEDGTLEVGSEIPSWKYHKTYKSYAKSMSQARANGANGFDSKKAARAYWSGTGNDEKAYAKPFVVKDALGKEHKTCFNVVDVAKAYKRFMVGASNGTTPTTGWLSTYSKDHTVDFIESGKGLVIGEIKPETYILKNSKGVPLTVVKIADFKSLITENHEFLVNIIDKNKALIGVEEFNYWNEDVTEVLTRNLTDGQGWVHSRVIDALRVAGCLNSFDAHQLRVSVATKGAVLCYDAICELLGADIVLTNGMVKSEHMLEDLRKNGFQLFVVGQRKDGANGAWIASQAVQHYGLRFEELKHLARNSAQFVMNSVKEKSAADLLKMFNVSEEETDKELNATSYARLAKEFSYVMDEQYIIDEMKSLGVKTLNKLLDAKVFVERARNRYMFTDPIAIFRAMQAGRYEVLPEDAVLKPYEVVAPSRNEEGQCFMEVGEAVCSRYPKGSPHESVIVKAVDAPEYHEQIEKGYWQGCVFFDAFSWVVAMMSGADHDGDMCTVSFESIIVAAVLRAKEKGFAGMRMLPLIDAWVKVDEDGKFLDAGTGCPTYIPEGSETSKEKVMEEKGKFMVLGNKIIFDPRDFEGKNADKVRADFIDLQAEMSHKITVSSIEMSLMGILANRIMILMDLLTRNVLNDEERLVIEKAVVWMCVIAKFEIDRPKHGGSYLEMPKVKELLANFDAIRFDDEQREWDTKKKEAFLEEKRGVYRHLYAPIIDWSEKSRPVIGYEVKKPQWLASQKDEYGIYHEDSTFEQVFGNKSKKTPLSYSEILIEHVIKVFKKDGSNPDQNNIRIQLMKNMEEHGQGAPLATLKSRVEILYNAYKSAEDMRRTAEKAFKDEHEEILKKEGKFRKKNMWTLSAAKKNAKLRAAYPEKLQEFSVARDTLKALLRKEMYALALELGVDIRALAGALYLVVGSKKTGTTSNSKPKDGRLYVYRSTNGYIALPFEVFPDEMQSLICDKISNNFFVPTDLAFTLVSGWLVSRPGVRVKVIHPEEKYANKVWYGPKDLRVAVRSEEQTNGNSRTVMNFLNKDAKVTSLEEVTLDHCAYRGIPRQEFEIGMYEVNVVSIEFDGTADTAIIYFG